MKKQTLKKKARKMALLEDSVLSRYLPAYYQQARIFTYMLSGFKGDLKVLDLACGGGALSYLIMQIYKQSSVVGFDESPEALEAYTCNLSGFYGRVSTLSGSLGQDDWGFGYDIAVSSMAMSTIEDSLKPVIYDQVYQSLKPGGIFIIRDFVSGTSLALNDQYINAWRKETEANELDLELRDSETGLFEYPAPMEKHLDWLKTSGFTDVDCHWRYLNFAIFGGRKPENTTNEGN